MLRPRLFSALIAVLAMGAIAPAGVVPPLEAVRVARFLSFPVFVTAAPGDFAKVFIVEKGNSGTARIRTATRDPFAISPTVFLTLTNITTNGEQGLWSIAPHPDYVNNGYFWVHYSDNTGATRVVRYRATGPNYRTSLTADTATATLVFTTQNPFTNHYGGWMAFGPDGMLYIAKGDGGDGGDPFNLAQNLNEPFGKIIRIDADGPDNIPGNSDDDAFPADPNKHYVIPADNPFASGGGLPEIWHYGLRNPWRCSFDRQTGALYIGDVGQGSREEINFQPPHIPGTMPGMPGYVGGMNFGWRCAEGTICTEECGPCAPGGTGAFPIHEYDHSVGCSVSGGVVYRGCNIPELRGTYFFSDFCTSTLWTFDYSGSGVVPSGDVIDRTNDLDPGGTAGIDSVVSFGEDAYGELYIIDIGGEIFRVKSQGLPFTAPDCNSNGRADGCDILDGTSQDADQNGLPDECSTGRCCLPNGTCQQVTAMMCSSLGGDFSGVGSSCSTGPCPAILRACCFDSGDCLTLGPNECLALGGTPQGFGVPCAVGLCPDVCSGDFNDDACVGLADIAVVIGGWDNPYTLADIAAIIGNWTRRCGPDPCPE